MNREIKFRAWKKESKEMNMVYSIDFDAYEADVAWKLLTFNDIELMQYTWLDDKNGKETYEGDVVEIRKDWKIFDEASIVIFSQYWGFQFYDMTFQNVFRDSNYEVRIIGNVFENPELLK